MKTPDQNSQDRIDALNSEIDILFADLDDDDLQLRLSNCWEVVTEMIEVTRVGRTSCDAIHLFDDITFKKIEFPQSVQKHLRVGDVFLVTMGKMDQSWRIYCSSPRYETEVFTFEDIPSSEELH